MRLKFPSIFIVSVLLLSIWIGGCKGKDKPTSTDYSYGETAFLCDTSAHSSPGNQVMKLNLIVNETYCKATACKCIQYLASREYDEVVENLKTNYNIDLQLTYCIEEDSIGMLLKTGKYDGVICKPWFALRLMPETGMKFKRIADVLDPFDEELLHGIFIVNKQSPLQKPEDINGKTIALGNEDSYEKYHMAMQSLNERKIKPGKFIYRGSCSESLDLLMDNKADVAVVSDYALIASCAVDFAPEDTFRILLKTDSIPLCSVILDLSKVDENDALRLQKALFKISSEKMPESFASKGFVRPVLWSPKPYLEIKK